MATAVEYDYVIYGAIAASKSNVILGATGSAGDTISSVTIVPATTSPGAVSITDGSGSAITLFTGGASSVATLHSWTVFLGVKSTSGAWKVTTGANVSVVCCGRFT